MKHRASRSFRYWLLAFTHLALVMAFMLTACRAQPQPMPTPPPPTATPLPPLPPVLVERSPARGEELPPDGTLQLVFDQPMNRASVEAAFEVSPPVEGTFSWPDDRTVQFKPKQPLDRDKVYVATIKADAKSAAGLSLTAPLRFKFATVGFLEVAQVIPAPNTREVETDATITVIFNRPVVPLTGIAEQANLPQPITIEPETPGRGEWLNTSIYVFRPDPALKASTTYTVRVAAGLKDVTGGVLAEAYRWSFTTVAPSVLFTDPSDGQKDVPLTRPITVTFNQRMDHASVEAAFSLTDAKGTRIPGTFKWFAGSEVPPRYDPVRGQEKPVPPSAEVMEFTPGQRLALDMSYTVRVEGSARTVEGTGSLGRPYEWSFHTVKAPAVLRTEPADGETRAEMGHFVIYFASPMDVRTIEPNLTITPKPTEVFTYYNEYENSFTINFPPQPSTAYEMRIGAGMADPYGNTLGQDTVVRFTTRPYPPAAYLNVPGIVGTYNAYTPTVVYAIHLNVTRLDFELYRLDLATFARLAGPGGYGEIDNFRPQAQDRLRSWSLPVSAPQNKSGLARVTLAETPEGRLAPGLYYLQVTAPELRTTEPKPFYRVSRHLLVVSGVNLTVKTGLREALVWATDMQSGQPVPGLPVRFYDQNFGRMAEAATDQDGVAQFSFSEPIYLWEPHYAVVQTAGSGPTSFALTMDQWSDGIAPWDWNLPTQWDNRPYQVYLYTDKPIYRPGQTVHFKGIVRANDDARYSLPTDLRALLITIQDWEGKRVYSQTLPISPQGTFYGDFKLSEAASLGYYSLNTVIRLPAVKPYPPEMYFGIGFQVAQYRRPEFQVKVTADRSQVLQGEDIGVSAEATYFFGAPVANAALTWRVFSIEHFFTWEGPGYYDFTDYDFTIEGERGPVFGGFGELIAEGQGRTDAQGRFTFKVPANLGTKTASQRFTIEVTVTDESAQAVSGRTAVTVHKGEFYIGLRPQSYIGQANRAQVVDIITVDWDQRPYGQVDLTVITYEHKWFSVQQEDAFGNIQWTWTVEDTPVYTTTVTTEQGGIAQVRYVPPRGGTYKILATGRDSQGHEVRASTYQWVTSGEYVAWRMENNDRIELRPDRRSYRPGDTAEILIPSPYQGETTALLTIERGRILERRLITLRSNSEVLRLPIIADYAPNVFVSVVIVKGVDATNPTASFKIGYAQLKVSPEQQELKITLTPDKPRLGPRDMVTYDVRVTDYSGKPVQAEFSFALVDLSVLSLAEPNAPPLVDAFYGPQGLGIRTASGLTIAVDRLNVRAASGFKGGGGGGAEAGAFEIRQEFPDTAYWNPAVMTDANGQAQVQITLPDTLTTWRLDVRGATAETTLVGQATVDIVTTKDLLIRPVTPRFFVVGDQARLGAIVNNNTDRAIDAEVDLIARGVELAGPSLQKVTVPARGQVLVTWQVTVPDVDAVDLTFTVRGGGLSDASKPPLGQPPNQLLPVYKYSTPETVGTAGEVDTAGDRTEAIVLPRKIDPTQGHLSIEIAPSLAAATRDGLTYLEHYPYECTEQTVSRFLPNVVTYRALKQLNLQNPALEARLPALVNEGLQRLYSQQHVDGGWGWWVNDQSNPTVTSYVLLGLVKAREAGFDISADVINRAVSYLRPRILPPRLLLSPSDANRQAYILYVLAEAGQGDVSATVNLYESRQKLDYYGRALLALALKLNESDESRIRTLLSDLQNGAITSATGMHWEEANTDYWNWNTDTRSTAIILDAFARLDPENALNPNIVRWLMVARRTGYWETTQETAWAILALTDWMVATGELQANYTYRVVLNGSEITRGSATADNLDEPVRLQIAIKDLILDQANHLTFQRDAGPGRLYYTAHLQTYVPAEEVRALSRGVIVGRQYRLVTDECRQNPDVPCPVVTSASLGDEIQVRLTLVAPHDLYYVVVEDPLPAGAEAIDASLLTTSAVGQPPELTRLVPGYGPGWGWWWFSHSELRDEKVVLFATHLPAGTYEYTYTMRATLPGQFKVLPTTAYEFYFPEVFGRSDGMLFPIEEQ